MIRIGHVLCPIDFSPFSARALRHAAAWSRWYGAQLTVLHVWHDVPAANILPSLQAPPPTETLPDAQRVAIEARMRQYCAEITPDTAVVCRVTQAPNVQTDIVEIGRAHV